jgi:hypothetical protein
MDLPLLDPPIAVKIVCYWFDNAMKLVKEINANMPFCRGCDDEEAPNTMRQLLEDLFDEDQSGQKMSALAQKKKDRDAAKAFQEAAVIHYSTSSSSSDASDESGQKPKRAKTESGEKKPHGLLNATLAVLAGVIEDSKEQKAANNVLKTCSLEEQQKMSFIWQKSS